MHKMLTAAAFTTFLASISTQVECQQAADAIIVTAEKRALPVQQTVASVAVVTKDDISAGGLRDVRDAYERVVNLAPTFGSSGFSIRGISNTGVSGAGEASTITVYMDDVPLASTYMQGAPTRLWDVEKVEVLRGPQSTLQGLNSLAGTVVIRTKDPSLDRWEAVLQASGTDESAYQLATAMGGPIIPGSLGVRLSAEATGRDGFIRNVTRHAGEDREETVQVRAKILWRPSTLDGLSGWLGYTHSHRDGGFFNVYARTDTPNFPHRRIATDNVRNATLVDYDAVSGELRYSLSNNLILTSVTTWSDVSETSAFDGDYSALEAAFAQQARQYKTKTQEVRLNLEARRLNGLLGVLYYDRNWSSTTVSRTDVPTPIGTIAGLLSSGGVPASQASAIATTYAQAMPAIRVDFDGSFPTHVRSYAAFGDLRLRILNRVILLGGFRIDHETNWTQNKQQSVFTGVLPVPATFGPLAPVIAQINGAVGAFVAQSNANLPQSHRSSTTLLPKAGLMVEWDSNLVTGIVVQGGYRSGGLSTNIARGESIPYDAEFTWNYELSFRSRLLNDRLAVNANAYYIDWRNQQVTVNFGLNSFDTNTVNAGKSHLHGFELEADYRASSEWSLFGALGYQRTRFNTFLIPQTGSVSSLSGTVFAFAPRWNLAGGATWRSSHGWSGNVTAKYSSSSFAAVGINQRSYPVAAHTIVSARLGYTRDRWSLHALVRNLFDTVYVMYKSPAESRAVLNDPRTIGAELRISL